MTEQELAGALFNSGLLTREQIVAAAAERSPHKNFAQVVVEKGWVSAAQIAQLDPHALPTQAMSGQAMPSAFDTSAFSQATNITGGQPLLNASPIPAPAFVPGGSAPAYHEGYPQSGNGTLILVFGILGLVFCQIFGPIAWIMGNNALAAIDAGHVNPLERTNANVGRILGIISTVFLVIIMVFVLLVMLAAITTTPNPNSFGTPNSGVAIVPNPPSP
ncbi:MAG TPA: DUF4190 domain-containing protein [Abditibacteriaceae bacterium]